jgi:hypothetical protein
VWKHGWRIAMLICALPVTGAIGWGLLAWLRRRDPVQLRRIIGAAMPGIIASLLLLWQTRTGPASQMMAAVGAAALVWTIMPPIWNYRWPQVTLPGKAGTVSMQPVAAALGIILCVGAAVPFVLDFIPEDPPTPYEKAIGKANGLCASLWGLHPIALVPKGLVFTFVDLGPRLITVTHHDAITGPYHRNWRQIVDVMNAWRGSAEQAHEIMVDKYHSNYVLSCPDSSTTTIFMSEAPQGFYGQLQRGDVPKWLQPVPLPSDSPYRMWKVVG